MKKLRNKVFVVIFSLLTIFTMIIFVTFSVQTYLEKQKSVEDVLTKMPRSMGAMYFDIIERIMENDNSSQDNAKIYLDFTIYTVVLNSKQEYAGIINHTSSEEIDEIKVKQIAESIIANHKDDIYIGNLYTNKYAYAFTPNNTLVIMDNTNLNHQLINQLLINTIIFAICEIVIFGFTYLITKWIITPVAKSFEKQKVFIADASHELKTPLSVMIASADAYFNDKDEKWVKNMKSESERMIKLVTELLDLAKTEQEQDIVLEENNLSDIIEGSILTFESLFYESKIKLDYDITPDIKMLCNESLIVELMSILIDNAIKHCSEKGKVIVNLSKNNKQIFLEVKNKGLPIKKEDEEKIFERFYKVDTSRNRNSNNYGLGLAIAKNIVEKQNGNISAHSSDGYTTFKVVWNQK